MIRFMIQFALLVLVAWSSPGMSQQNTVALPSCAVPDAVADDGLDDRAALQSALDTQRCAELGPGVYDVGINPLPGTPGLGSLTLTGGQTLRGAGSATVIRFASPQWGAKRAIRVTGDENLIADVMLDLSGGEATQEQAHLIEIVGGERNTVSRSWLYHPIRTGLKAGDCIRVLGEETNRASLIVDAVHFVECDRSGVAIQRATYGLVIGHSIFYKTGNSDIDAELTGSGIGGDWIISDCVFHDPRGLGGTAVSIAGIRAVERVVFKGNVLNGKGLNLGNTARTIVEGNVIVQRGRLAAIALVKRNDEVIMTSNYVTRVQTGAVPNTAPLVSAEHHNSGMPGRLTFSANHFVADGEGVAVDLRSALSVLMVSNVIEGNGPDAVRIWGSAQQTESAIVSANLFRGAFGRALDIGGVLRVSLTGNVAPGTVDSVPIGGVRCGVIGQIVMSGNLWGASTCNTP